MRDEREELIELGCLDRARRRRGLVRQSVGVGRHPVGDSLMHHAQGAADAAQVHPVDVELDRLAAEIGAVALGLRGGRVFAPARVAQVALTARQGAPVLDLLRAAVALRTGDQALLSHAHPFSHSQVWLCDRR